jgi:hypothetical protein
MGEYPGVLAGCGMMPSLDPVTHEVKPWAGPTWSNTNGTLLARPGTYCYIDGSHTFISSVCANCGLTYHADNS